MRLFNEDSDMKDKFDFGSLLNDQFKGIRPGYKFGKAFNEDKSLVRPAKPAVAVASDDNAALKTAFETNAPIAGLVEKEVKGGYEVTVAGQRAFCPYSQIDRFKKEPAEYLGRKFDFAVTEYSKDERGLSVVLSRRTLLEAEAAAKRAEAFAALEEGATVNGAVTRVFDFGAFVDVGGFEGLLPVREIAWERVEDPNAILKAGDAVTVKVIHVDRDAEKATFSRKECLPRVFNRTPEEEASAKSAEEVAAWMKENAARNANVGSLAGAFAGLKIR